MLVMSMMRRGVISVGSVVSFLLLVISLFTDHWLYHPAAWSISVEQTDRSLNNHQANTTEVIQKEIQSNSGLWRICCSEAECIGQCRILDYLTSEVDVQSTSSIFVIKFLRKSSIFPIFSILLNFSGSILLLTGEVWIKNKITFPLIGGVFFVLSGLSNVLGIIIYISSNDKLTQQKSSNLYGYSFYFAGIAFILSESLGVMIIQNSVKKIELLNQSSESDCDNVDVTKHVSENSNVKQKGGFPPGFALRRSMRKRSISNGCLHSRDLCTDGQLPLNHSNSSKYPTGVSPTVEANVSLPQTTPRLPISDSGYHEHYTNDNKNRGVEKCKGEIDHPPPVITRKDNTNLSWVNVYPPTTNASRSCDNVDGIPRGKSCFSSGLNVTNMQRSISSLSDQETTLTYPPPHQFTTTSCDGSLDRISTRDGALHSKILTINERNSAFLPRKITKYLPTENNPKSRNKNKNWKEKLNLKNKGDKFSTACKQLSISSSITPCQTSSLDIEQHTPQFSDYVVTDGLSRVRNARRRWSVSKQLNIGKSIDVDSAAISTSSAYSSNDVDDDYPSEYEKTRPTFVRDERPNSFKPAPIHSSTMLPSHFSSSFPPDFNRVVQFETTMPRRYQSTGFDSLKDGNLRHKNRYKSSSTNCLNKKQYHTTDGDRNGNKRKPWSGVITAL